MTTTLHLPARRTSPTSPRRTSRPRNRPRRPEHPTGTCKPLAQFEIANPDPEQPVSSATIDCGGRLSARLPYQDLTGTMTAGGGNPLSKYRLVQYPRKPRLQSRPGRTRSRSRSRIRFGLVIFFHLNGNGDRDQPRFRSPCSRVLNSVERHRLLQERLTGSRRTNSTGLHRDRDARLDRKLLLCVATRPRRLPSSSARRW